jgi:hypothetical protein
VLVGTETQVVFGSHMVAVAIDGISTLSSAKYNKKINISAQTSKEAVIF